MTLSSKLLIPVLVCICSVDGLIFAQPAFADAAAETRLRDQLRQTITELRAAQDENASLNARLATQAAAPAPVVQDHPKQDAELRQSRQELQHLQQQVAALNEALADTRLKLSEAEGTIAETNRRVQIDDGALQVAQKAHQKLEIRDKSCEAKNHQLTALFDEVLAHYQDRTVMDAVLEREPLTGLKRAQLERLTDGYRSKGDALHVGDPDGAEAPE